MKDVAANPDYQEIKDSLKNQLHAYLRKTADPRILGQPALWDEFPYYKEKDWIATPRKEAQRSSPEG